MIAQLAALVALWAFAWVAFGALSDRLANGQSATMPASVTAQPTSYFYSAASGQTDFPVLCRIFTGYEDDWLVSIDGIPGYLTYASGTVPAAGQFCVIPAPGNAEGGTIRLTARTLGQGIRIIRQLPLERVTQLLESGPIDIIALNNDLSRIIALLQDEANTRLEADNSLVLGFKGSGSKTWDPGSIASGAQTTTTIACTVDLSQVRPITVAFSNSLQGCILSAYASATNVVTVVLTNLTGAPVDLPSGTLFVRVA